MPAAKPRTNKRSSDEAVKAATGRVWAEWFKILDKAGAKSLSHKEIWTVLKDEQKVGPWWAQMVAVEYERERGIRDMHQKCTGEYSASSSRTMNMPISKLYGAWVDDKLRKVWLAADKLEISTKTENKSLRGAWDGNKSRLSVNFYAKGPQKTQIAVDHMKLADSKECERMKAYWSAALDRLQESLLA
jgi:uncharacterized protein DUF4287